MTTTNSPVVTAINESILSEQYNGTEPQEFLEGILRQVSDWVETSNECEGGIEIEYLVAERLLEKYFPNSEFLAETDDYEYTQDDDEGDDYDPNYCDPIDECRDEWFDDSDLQW